VNETNIYRLCNALPIGATRCKRDGRCVGAKNARARALQVSTCYHPCIDDFYLVSRVSHCRWLLHALLISDGWDRTSQLAAVAQLLLDPYYRTISGFGALIEKDFCSFGHMFAKRSDPSSSEYSPIFLQFLDCCWQVLRQFPGAFEFNAQFLLTIVEGQQSSWSATFRGDCESERKDATGPCLWQLIDLENCRNAAYVPAAPGAPPLRPKVAMQAIHLWSDLYFLHSPLV